MRLTSRLRCLLIAVIALAIWCLSVLLKELPSSIFLFASSNHSNGDGLNENDADPKNNAKLSAHCDIYEWKNNSVTVYNCSKSRKHTELSIAIASFHKYAEHGLSKKDVTLFDLEHSILSNHLAYVLQHGYIYFDVHDLIFDDVELRNYTKTNLVGTKYAMYKFQKPFIVHSILSEHPSIDYAFWIDFDAIFYNCSHAMSSLVRYTQQLYAAQNVSTAIDVTFASEGNSVANAGAILFKQSPWTLQFLQKQMFIFQHAADLDFADIVHVRGLIDQIVLNSLLLGYDPLSYDDGDWNAVHDGLRATVQGEKGLHQKGKIKNFNWGNYRNDDPEHCFQLHAYLGEEIKAHAAIVPQIYINLGYGQWVKKIKQLREAGLKKEEMQYHAYRVFVLHFCGPGKHSIAQKIKAHQKAAIYRHCYL